MFFKEKIKMIYKR